MPHRGPLVLTATLLIAHNVAGAPALAADLTAEATDQALPGRETMFGSAFVHYMEDDSLATEGADMSQEELGARADFCEYKLPFMTEVQRENGWCGQVLERAPFLPTSALVEMCNDAFWTGTNGHAYSCKYKEGKCKTGKTYMCCDHLCDTLASKTEATPWCNSNPAARKDKDVCESQYWVGKKDGKSYPCVYDKKKSKCRLSLSDACDCFKPPISGADYWESVDESLATKFGLYGTGGMYGTTGPFMLKASNRKTYVQAWSGCYDMIKYKDTKKCQTGLNPLYGKEVEEIDYHAKMTSFEEDAQMFVLEAARAACAACGEHANKKYFRIKAIGGDKDGQYLHVQKPGGRTDGGTKKEGESVFFGDKCSLQMSGICLDEFAVSREDSPQQLGYYIFTSRYEYTKPEEGHILQVQDTTKTFKDVMVGPASYCNEDGVLSLRCSFMVVTAKEACEAKGKIWSESIEPYGYCGDYLIVEHRD